MVWFHKFFFQFSFYRGLVTGSKRTKVPGVKTVTVFELAHDFFDEIGKESIVTKASALAYRFLLATFPAIIFVFTLIPFIPLKNFQPSLLNTFQQILPDNVFAAAETTLREIVIKQNKSLLSAGFLASLLFSTNGVSALIKQMNKSSLELNKRNYLQRRIKALILTIVLVFLLLSSAFVGITGQFVVSYLYNHHFIKGILGRYSLVLLQWILVALVFYFTIAILYYYGPSRKHRKEFITAGTGIASILSILTTYGFAKYVQYFGNYNKVYGSIGTLIVIMILLYLNSAILLICYDFDISLERCRLKHINKGGLNQKNRRVENV